MREAEDSGVSRCEGLGTAGWGKLGDIGLNPACAKILAHGHYPLNLG
jgi:hypothetical protein